MMKVMAFLRNVLFVCPLFCALAQTPPPASRPATAVPAAAPANAQEGAPDPNSRSFQVNVLPPPPQFPPDMVVVKVGDIQLNVAQLNVLADNLAEPMRSIAKGKGRKEFVENIARVLALAEEGRRRKYNELDTYVLQNKFNSDQLLAGYAWNALDNEVHLDDAALHAYYDAHKGDYERVHVQQIVVRTEGSAMPLKAGSRDLSGAEALAKARELIRRAKKGEDFGKLAAAESDEFGADSNHGDICWFGKGQMPPSLEEAAFKMTKGQISEPIQTGAGYHILKLQERQVKSFDEIKGEIETKLRPEKLQTAVNELIKNSKVEYNTAYFDEPKK
jgi:peptidyl-prolyl cis-trans isomerase C